MSMNRVLCAMLLAAAVVVAGMASRATAAGEGQTCGGFIGAWCDFGLWCEPPAGKCGGADLQGRCVKVSEICPKIFKPVCGCDQKTYGNDCERRAAKVAKAYNGRCRKQ